ncbi:MAG: diacylglycerol/lipid kinase family protein [Porcipelethomonas sp.]
MKKMYFIANLQSGKAKISSKLGTVIDMFTKSGYEVTVRPTQDRLDASKAAGHACENNFDIIVCSGGDGTLNEVIHGVMQCENRLPIGYIPSGSTNDFARGMEIPTDIEAAVEGVINGEPFPCDVGRFNERYFTYIAAFGAFTEVTYQTSQHIKNILGYVAYILNGLSHLSKIKSYHMKITYDEGQIEGDYIFGMVTNSSSVAGLLSLNEFLADDGLYEVTLIKKTNNPLDLQRIIHSLLNIDIDLDTRYIKSFRTSKIKFECEDEISWTVDGEFGGAYRCSEIENISKAVRLIIDRKEDVDL